tara:strand:+ start:433 stop:810 length:378 start_codon:yes stop_codon:yes gene_type:complete
MAFSNGVLQRDRIQFLMQINNEAKTRRSTRAEILGKAKVMGFEELEEARAKRAEQLATKAAKGTSKRGRKRKATLEGEERQAKSTRQIDVQVEGQDEVQVEGQVDVQVSPAWRAPVAPMIPASAS